MSLSRQEMFDRAYRGLASQGWRVAFDGHACVYQTDDGRRCAWGWVDMSLTDHDGGPVDEVGTGLAVGLNMEEMTFACRLQECHDRSDDNNLQGDMRKFAERHSLTIPELP